jgi:hypothetical protein
MALSWRIAGDHLACLHLRTDLFETSCEADRIDRLMDRFLWRFRILSEFL